MKSSNYTWKDILAKRKAIILSMTVGGVLDTDGTFKEEYLEANGVHGYRTFVVTNILSYNTYGYRTEKEQMLIYKYVAMFLPGITKVNFVRARREYLMEMRERTQKKNIIQSKMNDYTTRRASMLEVSSLSFSFIHGINWNKLRVVHHETFYISWLKKKLTDENFARKFVKKYVLVCHLPNISLNIFYKNMEKFINVLTKHNIVLFSKLRPIRQLVKYRVNKDDLFFDLLIEKIIKRTGYSLPESKETFDLERQYKFCIALRKNKLYIIVTR